MVRNTGTQMGIAKIELAVNGKTLGSMEVPLYPGEDKQEVAFVIIVPQQGTYTVTMGNLTDSFEVRNQ